MVWITVFSDALSQTYEETYVRSLQQHYLQESVHIIIDGVVVVTILYIDDQTGPSTNDFANMLIVAMNHPHLIPLLQFVNGFLDLQCYYFSNFIVKVFAYRSIDLFKFRTDEHFLLKFLYLLLASL